MVTGRVAKDTLSSATLTWMATAVTAFGLALISVVLVLLSRVPGLSQYLGVADLFSRALLLHVDTALGIWFMAAVAGAWSMALGNAARTLDAVLFATGALLLVVAALFGEAPVWLNDYLPAMDHDLFWSGLVLVLLGWGMSAVHILVPRHSKAEEGQSETRWLLRMSAAIGLVAVTSGLVQFWFAGRPLDQVRYADTVWGASHLVMVSVTLVALALLGELVASFSGRRAPLGARLTAVGVSVPILVVSLLMLGLAPNRGTGSTMYTWMMEWAGSCAMVYLAYLWVQSRKVSRSDCLERVYFIFSLLLYFCGSLLGFFISQNNALVPAHYHGVIGGISLLFMWMILAHLHQTADVPRSWSRGAQAKLYALGVSALMIGFIVSDLPRKVEAISHAAGAVSNLGLTLLVAGGMAGVTAGGWFVVLGVRGLTKQRPMGKSGSVSDKPVEYI